MSISACETLRDRILNSYLSGDTKCYIPKGVCSGSVLNNIGVVFIGEEDYYILDVSDSKEVFNMLESIGDY